MSFAEFHDRIAEMAVTEDAVRREEIRTAIWERWGVEGAVFITDMAAFSSTVRYRGITYFLAMIHRARKVLRPIIEGNGGRVLKFETDNAFAFFPDPADAIRAAIASIETLHADNRGRPKEDHIELGIGIDFGRILLVDDRDFYGDAVNTGSKLGEDLADTREIFVTRRALERSGLRIDGVVPRARVISDIEIEYVEIPVPRD